jgi:hypothetical protein
MVPSGVRCGSLSFVLGRCEGRSTAPIPRALPRLKDIASANSVPRGLGAVDHAGRHTFSKNESALGLLEQLEAVAVHGKRSSQAGAVYARHRHTIVSAETLSKMWNIGLETAQRTLRVTTQNGLRTAVHPITRRYRVDRLHLQISRPSPVPRSTVPECS